MEYYILIKNHKNIMLMLKHIPEILYSVNYRIQNDVYIYTHTYTQYCHYKFRDIKIYKIILVFITI